MSTRLTHPRRRARGSVMVEMSLVGTLFLILLLAILDFGQFLFLQQALVERVRYAARWGAIHDPANTTAIRNMVLSLRSTEGKASFGLTADMVSVTTPDAGTDHYRLVVQVTGYSYSAMTPLLARRYTAAPVRVTIPLGLYQ